jgi:tetratricopeptide (TPR) repeat protein
MNSVDPNEAGRTVIPETPETPVANLWQRWRQERCPDFPDPATGGLSAEQALAVLRYDQCQLWQAGERVPAERYLQTYRVLKTDPDQALVLIYGEFLLRQELGETPTLDEYLQRFPDRAELLREQDAFHRALEGVSWLDPVAPALPEQAGVCRVVGEIARGGMGMILKGHDERLGRDLAVKVLRDEYKDRPEVVGRFLEEARVSGQLQHPGIVPVHEVGQFEDGRPYFTMKLVKGRTLGSLLSERKVPREDLPRFLKIFEQVCQTLAYAHSKGVIHRDLKPANVMVGAFGEVQVMDWGLAKQLQSADCRLQIEKGHETVEDGSSAHLESAIYHLQSPRTQAGQAVGTPAYMAPEQARGEGSILDERCDVFGLGAVLCEILTGQPPYVGQRALEILDQARRCALDGALARLDGCGADAELLELAKACLAPAPQDRPRNAGAVAERVTAYLASVQERLRQVEAERAAAQARTQAEAKTRAAEKSRRRTALALAAALVLLVAGAGAAWLMRSTERIVRRDYLNKEAGLALDEAAEKRTELHRKLEDPKQVEELLSDIDQWQARLQGAQGAWERARALAAADRDLLSEDLATKLQELGSGLVADHQDWALVKELDGIRLQTATMMVGRPGFALVAKQYFEVFVRIGLDVDNGDPAELADRIARSRIRYALVAALDHWAEVVPRQEFKTRRARLLAVARQTDPHPWRDRFRQEHVWNDVEQLRPLAKELRPQDQSPQVIIALANQLQLKDQGAAVAVLRWALLHHPRDFWLNLNLGAYTTDPLERVSCNRTAVAFRPRDAVAHNNLGHALRLANDPEGASAEFRRAVELDPDYAVAHYNLGLSLFDRNDLDGAMTEYLAAIRLDSTLSEPHNNLGNLLFRKNDFDGAIAEYEKAVRLDANNTRAHYNFGVALHKKGDLARAIAELTKAIDLDPKLASAYVALGDVLSDENNLKDAIAAYRKGIDLDASHALTYVRLGDALYLSKDVEGAIAEYHKAMKVDPKAAAPHHNLGVVLHGKNDLDGAVAEYRKGIELDPDDKAEAHINLGRALYDKKDLDAAITEFRKAIQLDPNHAESHVLLGNGLSEKNDLEGAITEYRKAIQLNPNDSPAHVNLGNALYDSNDLEGAITEYRKAGQLDAKAAEPHNVLGNVLFEKNDLQGAIAEYRQATQLDPQHALAHVNLGSALRTNGELTKAVAAFRRGHELGTKIPNWPHPSAEWLRSAERLAEFDGKLTAILRGTAQPADAAERTEFAKLCLIRKFPATAARFYQEAFAAQPALAEDLTEGKRYEAARAAALAGCGVGKDDPPLGEERRAGWRRQALAWFRADLALQTKELSSNAPLTRATAQQTLYHWQRDPDLAGLRDEAALAKLPEAEQAACRQLWADVQKLLEQARTKR